MAATLSPHERKKTAEGGAGPPRRVAAAAPAGVWKKAVKETLGHSPEEPRSSAADLLAAVGTTVRQRREG